MNCFEARVVAALTVFFVLFIKRELRLYDKKCMYLRKRTVIRYCTACQPEVREKSFWSSSCDREHLLKW